MTEINTEVRLPSAALNDIDNVADLARLLNDSYRILYKEDDRPFTSSLISYYAFYCKNKYTAFTIPKKNGGLRPINAPTPFLKLIQRCANHVLQNQFSPHFASHGFLIDRSIVTNASKHVRKQFVLNMDIENFFGSIDFRRVKIMLEMSPFNLTDSRENLAFLISNLCCNNGVLPQGSPTSPLLTNIICQRLDRKLSKLAKTSRAIYTRYADDISFSSNQPIFSEPFVAEVKEVLKTEGFVINPAKTRLQNNRQRQVVTGIKVNEKLNVDRSLIRTIRVILHNATRGWDFAQTEFDKTWDKSRGPIPNFISSVRGQIEFVGMVRGKEDAIYKKYRRQFREMFEDLHDYNFVSNEKVRLQLIRDWDKMKKVKVDPGVEEEDRFTEYCITAFMQIEELINYYCTYAMPFDTLLSELSKHTFLDRSRSKDKTNVSQIDMVYKMFLFENYFFYKKDVYYDSVINKIRLVRNQGLHRCSVIVKDEESIRVRYTELQEKIKAYNLKNKVEYRLTNRDRHLEYEIKLIPFLKERNYNSVKQAVISVAEKVKSNLKA